MNTFFIIFLGIPAIEIFLLIKIGGKIGALNTITLIFLTAIIGIYYARYEGLNTLKSGIAQISKNEIPQYEMLSGAIIAFAAVLLIIPGFVTDFIGFLLIFPVTRKLLFNYFAKKFQSKQKKEDKKNILLCVFMMVITSLLEVISIGSLIPFVAIFLSPENLLEIIRIDFIKITLEYING